MGNDNVDVVMGHSPVIKKNVQTMEVVPKPMNFFDALRAVKEGKRITKLEWKNKDMYGVMLDNFLRLHKPDQIHYQWLISDGDMAGEDWIVLEDKN